MTIRMSCVVTAMALTLAMTGGCDQKTPDDMPTLNSCVLHFKQDGKPLTDATVTLYSAEGSKWNGSGRTDATGKSVIYTHGLYQGLSDGKYKVCVTKSHSVVAAVPEKGTKEYEQYAANNGRVPGKTVHKVDLKYELSETTPLSLEMKGKKFTETFEVGPSLETEVIDKK